MNEIISAAVLLILIMDPLGNLPIFMSVLKHTEPKDGGQSWCESCLLLSR